MVPVPCMFPLSTLEIDVFCCYLLRYVWSNLGVRVLQLGVPLFRFIPPILQTLQEKGVGAFLLLFTMHGTKSVVLTYFFKRMNEGHERP